MDLSWNHVDIVPFVTSHRVNFLTCVLFLSMSSERRRRRNGWNFIFISRSFINRLQAQIVVTALKWIFFFFFTTRRL